jgi:hypothetical protein
MAPDTQTWNDTASSFDGGLDELAALDCAALERIYAQGRVPGPGALGGHLRGRMLATTFLPGPLAALARAVARSAAFPWRGKTFWHGDDRPVDADQGHGHGSNRVLNDITWLFRFETSIGPSRAGTFPALQLDYDLPENPGFIRAIKDEIRQVAPGLFLGQAYWMTARGPHLVRYFAVQAA